MMRRAATALQKWSDWRKTPPLGDVPASSRANATPERKFAFHLRPVSHRPALVHWRAPRGSRTNHATASLSGPPCWFAKVCKLGQHIERRQYLVSVHHDDRNIWWRNCEFWGQVCDSRQRYEHEAVLPKLIFSNAGMARKQAENTRSKDLNSGARFVPRAAKTWQNAPKSCLYGINS